MNVNLTSGIHMKKDSLSDEYRITVDAAIFGRAFQRGGRWAKLVNGEFSSAATTSISTFRTVPRIKSMLRELALLHSA